MKLNFEEIQQSFGKDFVCNQATREARVKDFVFFWVTHWDDALLADSQLEYRGEFDLLRKGYRDIMGDLRANPIQADFEPVNTSKTQIAEIMDGYYRASCRNNSSKEAFDNASMEQVVCGLGGWRLCTEYEDNLSIEDRRLKVTRKPIYEFNSCVFWDSTALRIDKSDARHVTVLSPFTPSSFVDFYYQQTGKRISEDEATQFATPETGFTFPWVYRGGTNDWVYIGEHYVRYKEKQIYLHLKDMLGDTQIVKKGDHLELIEQGYEIYETKTVERYVVDKYFVSGCGIIGKPQRIAGEHLPVVPCYGERAFISGVEHYEGIVKAAKDAQMLRDFGMSYLADIVGRSPRIKPIYAQEQIAGFEFMYNETGADNAYPYLLQNLYDPNGNPLPIGSIGTTPEQPVPSALLQLMGEVRQSVEDNVTNGLPNDISDIDLSGKAVNAMLAQFDQQSLVFQQNKKYAIRRDAEIFASMVADIKKDYEEITIATPQGNRKEVEINVPRLNIDNGEIELDNDISNARFEVFADVGKSYETTRQEARETLQEMLVNAVQVDPQLAQIIQLKQLALSDGIDTEDLREWAQTQLVLRGIRKPETEEEMAALEAQQQASQQQQDPNMALAMAEQMKAENGRIKNEIDMFKAESDRMKVMIDAEKAGAEITHKDALTESVRIDDVMKLRGSVNSY
jgi:hypothetical protein